MSLTLIITAFLATSAACGSESDFIKTCPPSKCGSFQIRFPLRLQSDNPLCSLNGLDLTCSHDNKTLHLSAYPQFKITDISYEFGHFTLDIGSMLESESSPCLLQNLSSIVKNFNNNILSYSVKFVRCSKKIGLLSNPNSYYHVAGPIPLCFEKENYFVYVADVYEFMDVLGCDCEVFWNGGEIPMFDDGLVSFANSLKEFMDEKEVNFTWTTFDCTDCEAKGKYCGFDWEGNQTFCFDPWPPHGELAAI